MRLRERFAVSRCAGDPGALLAPPTSAASPPAASPPGRAEPPRPTAASSPERGEPLPTPTTTTLTTPRPPPELDALADGEAGQTYRLFRRQPAWRTTGASPSASERAGSSARADLARASRPTRSAPATIEPATAATPEYNARAPATERVVGDGYQITRLRVPRDLELRPPLLGRAIDRLTWPSLERWREIAAILRPPATADPPLADDGGVPMVALDTETTGLSRSAGTLAFLIGLAWIEPTAIVVEQWTLTALTGEVALLRGLGERLAGLGGPATTLVTFNGASFDLPLLRARYRRIRRPAPERLGGPHLDLLMPARRLWREPAGDCRLATLERTRLGVHRQGDVHGREIPEVFAAALERPADRAAALRLEQVHAHNQVDLLTLPALADALARAVVAPSSLREALAVARWQSSRGLVREALAALEPWIGAPPASSAPLASIASTGPRGAPGGPADAPLPPPLPAHLPSPGGRPRADAPHSEGSDRSGSSGRSTAATPPPGPATAALARDPRDARQRPATGPRAHALGRLAERLVRLGLVADAASPPPPDGERYPIRRRGDQTSDADRGGDDDDDRRAPPGDDADDPRAPSTAAREPLSHGEEPTQDPVPPADGFTSLERAALTLAARLWRRCGEPARAAACWARICRARPGDPEAHEALAGLLEHRLGDLEAALRVAERSRDPCPRRLGRLARKLSRRSPPAPHSVYG